MSRDKSKNCFNYPFLMQKISISEIENKLVVCNAITNRATHQWDSYFFLVFWFNSLVTYRFTIDFVRKLKMLPFRLSFCPVFYFLVVPRTPRFIQKCISPETKFTTTIKHVLLLDVRSCLEFACANSVFNQTWTISDTNGEQL